jgi:4-oxalocrotonate tautomerase
LLEFKTKEPTVPLIQAKLNEEVCMPAHKAGVIGNLTDGTVSIAEGHIASAAWVDIEEMFGDEWEIGGLAMTTDAIRSLIAGE